MRKYVWAIFEKLISSGQILNLPREQWKKELLAGRKSDQNSLQKRLAEEPWTAKCTTTSNGFSLATSDTLSDTGASGYLFISRDLTKKAIKYLKPILVTNVLSPITRFGGKATQIKDVNFLTSLKIQW